MALLKKVFTEEELVLIMEKAENYRLYFSLLLYQYEFYGEFLELEHPSWQGDCLYLSRKLEISSSLSIPSSRAQY